jgi:hypothetical protein
MIGLAKDGDDSPCDPMTPHRLKRTDVEHDIKAQQ